MLALEANHLVAVDRLIDLVWGDEPPARARALTQTRVSELRAAVAAMPGASSEVELVTTGDGYRLDVCPDVVDAYRFLRLVDEARSCPMDGVARDHLRAALDLWRGPIMGGQTAEGRCEALCRGLLSARATALEDLYEIELRLGNHYCVVDELAQTQAANPTRERLVGQTMIALSRTGRRAEALQTYADWRNWLHTEYAVEPPVELERLNNRIAHRDAVHAHPRDAVSAANTLPPAPADFVGRRAELNAVHRVLDRRRPHGTAVVALTGQVGVGKTALAVCAAADLAPSYPEGQFFVDLGGLSPDAPAHPALVLQRLLRSLVDADDIPDAIEDRIDLYRAVLARRRTLLVLDDAVADEQLQPIIPTVGSTALIITARRSVGTSLGARLMPVDALSAAAAIQLLSRIIGSTRVQVEIDAAAKLCELCDYLPLALRAAGAKLLARPHWTLATLARKLNDESVRLDYLCDGVLDVRDSIERGYRQLSGPDQSGLLALAQLPERQLTAQRTADLVGLPPDVAAELLDRLADAKLVGPASGGDGLTYHMHGLIRAFAREVRRQSASSGTEPRPLPPRRDQGIVASEVPGWR